jgi:hypothetical protein
VSKTALRAASVVMLRVWRRGVAATSFLRVVLRFCSACQCYARRLHVVKKLTLVGRLSSMALGSAMSQRARAEGRVVAASNGSTRGRCAWMWSFGGGGVVRLTDSSVALLLRYDKRYCARSEFVVAVWVPER